ncbi:MAG: hypothetical protein ABIZ34_00800 [Candidatus Limnocylindrales bacterium]
MLTARARDLGLEAAFWSVPAYSIVVQGREVTRIAEPDEVCARGGLSDGVPITDQETRTYGTGWFHLNGLSGD